jgi:hypothetical protein
MSKHKGKIVCKHQGYCQARAINHVCTEKSKHTIGFESKCDAYEKSE